MKTLITGAAGYIGSFMVKTFIERGYDFYALDSLERGHNQFIIPEERFIKGDLRDKAFVKSIFSSHQFDAVIHFAGYIAMGESMEHPGMYFENNIFPVVHILEELKRSNEKYFIFSSTA